METANATGCSCNLSSDCPHCHPMFEQCMLGLADTVTVFACILLNDLTELATLKDNYYANYSCWSIYLLYNSEYYIAVYQFVNHCHNIIATPTPTGSSELSLEPSTPQATPKPTPGPTPEPTPPVSARVSGSTVVVDVEIAQALSINIILRGPSGHRDKVLRM